MAAQRTSEMGSILELFYVGREMLYSDRSSEIHALAAYFMNICYPTIFIQVLKL